MKQEDKERLLKDLCARLPYGVLCHIEQHLSGSDLNCVGRLHSITNNYVCTFDDVVGFLFGDFDLETEVRPYLRPMSSMTQEEIKKYYQLCEICECDLTGEPSYFDTCESFDYLNSIHVDYRNFIQRGLALEAPKDMYK